MRIATEYGYFLSDCLTIKRLFIVARDGCLFTLLFAMFCSPFLADISAVMHRLRYYHTLMESSSQLHYTNPLHEEDQHLYLRENQLIITVLLHLRCRPWQPVSIVLQQRSSYIDGTNNVDTYFTYGQSLTQGMAKHDTCCQITHYVTSACL